MIHQQPEDKAREHAVVRALEAEWKCTGVEFPPLSPIDWYLRRGEQVIAFVEIKMRRRLLDDFDTLFLDVSRQRRESAVY
jgi:hypothetical protein